MSKDYNRLCAYCGSSIQYKRGFRPLDCPYCGEKNWLKPETETKLFLLQKVYLEKRDKETLSEMYILLKSYSSSIIKKIISGKFKYDLDWLEMKAHDAVMSLLEYYLVKPEFKVDLSFGAYLGWKVKEVLYLNKKEEIHDSLNAYAEENSSSEEIHSYLYANGYQLLFGKNIYEADQQEKEKNNLINDILAVIDRQLFKIRSKSSNLSLLLCVYLDLLLSNRKNSLMNIEQLFNGYGKNFLNIIEILIFRKLRGVSKNVTG